MTKGITNRITIQEFVNALNKLDFDDVTVDNLQKLLPTAKIDFVNKVEDGMTDISIDDYTFTIHKMDGKPYPIAWLLIGYPPNKPYLLSNYVEVYLPTQEDDNTTYGEIQAEGYIETHNAGEDLWLKLEFHVN